MSLINYLTYPGDRKKYFKSAPLSQRLTNYLALMGNEKKLIEELIQYREEHISCSQEKINLQNSYAYKDHILKVEELLINSINKFKEIEIKNQSEN